MTNRLSLPVNCINGVLTVRVEFLIDENANKKPTRSTNKAIFM
ncbi:hypothetical protein [Psychroserpens mesophilus]